MNPDTKHLDDAAVHDLARNLAAESVDAELQPSDAQWLALHLDGCPDCASVAAEYQAIHDELRSLPKPEPPRDLWARTSAALDQLEQSSPHRSPVARKAARPSSRPLVSTALAVGFVVVVAAASLLVQSPLTNTGPNSTRSTTVSLGTASPGQATEVPQGPLAVVNGTSYWIASDAGLYEIKGGTAECSATDSSCTVANGAGQTLGSIASDSAVSAVIAPDATQAAVWTGDKVAILPLAAQPSTVTLDQLTPRPTIAATPTPTLSPTPSATEPAGSPETGSTGTPIAGQASGPGGSVVVGTPVPTAAPTPTATPSATPAATPAAASQPTAILTGYEIVGHDPQFSPDGSLVAFSARPVDHSAGPDVFLWRAGQEQATAITSSHSDLFAGWYGQRILVSEISASGSGADGAAATPAAQAGALSSISYVFDPSNGSVLQIDRPMLLPAVDPTGAFLVYWSGSVEFDPASGLWQPGKGDLYFDSWSDLRLTPASFQPVAASASPSLAASPGASASATASATATPTFVASPSVEPASPTPAATASPIPMHSAEPAASPLLAGTATPSATPTSEPSPAAPELGPAATALPQLLAVADQPGGVHVWSVRWDSAGQHVAIWVADPGSSRIGRLRLLSIDRTTGVADLNEKLLSVDKVLPNISIDDGHLVYTLAVDGKTYMMAIPALPPSLVSTPVPTTPGQLPSGSTSSGSPAPQASDRPGN